MVRQQQKALDSWMKPQTGFCAMILWTQEHTGIPRDRSEGTVVPAILCSQPFQVTPLPGD